MSTDPEQLAVSAEERARLDKEIQALDTVITQQDYVRKLAKDKSVRKSELSQPWAIFIRRMRLLTSQSWGARVQNYIAQFYNWETVAQKLNRGDATIKDGSHVEIKVTMITASNGEANFVQVRPYQDIVGYRMFVVDINYRVWRFDLTKKQMADEIALIGQSAHGTKETVKSNPNKEYAVRFRWDPSSPVVKRWKNLYYVSTSTEVTPDQMSRYHYQPAATVRKISGIRGIG